jgi:hypothetical protein
MYKKAGMALFAMLLSFAVTGLLVGCEEKDDTPGAPTSDIVEISASHQTVNDIIDMTNYQVVFKHTPEEWIALSDAERERLVKLGYDKVVEQIRADGVSNYNIYGTTAPVEDAEGNLTTQRTFFLNIETSVLNICKGVEADNPKKPAVSAEVPVELPLG